MIEGSAVVCTAEGVETSWVFTLETEVGTVLTQLEGYAVFHAVADEGLLDVDSLICGIPTCIIEIVDMDGTGSAAYVEQEVQLDFVEAEFLVSSGANVTYGAVVYVSVRTVNEAIDG